MFSLTTLVVAFHNKQQFANFASKTIRDFTEMYSFTLDDSVNKNHALHDR